jgi:hypothetical protein
MLVDGQLVGGAAQGVGGAMLEEFAYDAEGQLLTGSFADYLLPSTIEVPRIEVVLTEDAPSPRNPLGLKERERRGTSVSGRLSPMRYVMPSMAGSRSRDCH